MNASPIIIIGAGIAGLSTAIRMAPYPVTVLTGAPLGEGAATAWAQGGIAAAMTGEDSPEQHAADTVAAGAGFVDKARALLLSSHAEEQIKWLDKLGVPFDRDEKGSLKLGREAAHGRSRIVHAGGDSTGAAVMQTLIRAAKKTESITFLSGWSALDLQMRDGRVAGIYVQQGEKIDFLPASGVVLATGGIGQLFSYTTNPPSACGDGLALAARAGAELGDLEFVQFHPTALALKRDPLPLLTEALRGEGAILINEKNQRFMLEEHASAELAPRDIVARAIWKQLQLGHQPMLDARQSSGKHFKERYPFIFKTCQEAGLDPVTQPLPVVPAAHYHMGGVIVDEWGRSTLSGLWVCGEVSCTGIHGANRLASNSLLEALVFAERIAQDLKSFEPASLLPAREILPPLPLSASLVSRNALRKSMFDQCGLVRDAEGLFSLLESLQPGLKAASSVHLVAAMTALMAYERRESRGSHFRSDFPMKDETADRRHITLTEFTQRSAALFKHHDGHDHKRLA
jgi:L-aspartate oxidase